MPRRTSLGQELKRRFQEQRRPVSRVAHDLGLSVNSLRSWMRRNVFPKEQLDRVVEAAGISGDAKTLAEIYDFEVARGRRTYGRRLAELASDDSPDREDVLAAILDRWRAFQENGPPVSQELRAIVRTLQHGEIYVCCFGDALPAEWTGTGWRILGIEVAEAVHRGAHLVYLFPSTDAVRRLRLHGLFEYLGPETVEGAIAQFRTRVTKAFPGLGESEVANRIVGLPIDVGSFLAPRHQYIFVTGAGDNSVPSAGFLRVTESLSGGSLPLMPLGREIVSGFLSVFLCAAEHAGHQSLVAWLGGTAP